MQTTGQHGVVHGGIGPAPEHSVGFTVQTQQLAGANWWLSNALRQCISAHPVLDGQDG
jgi:hypothetical protein